MKNLVLAVCLAFVSGSVQAVPFENYFDCTVKEGKTVADAVQFLRAYQDDVHKKWDDYDLKILVPIYSESRAPGKIVWFGGFDSADIEDIRVWFRASEWARKFPTVLSCGSSSLWEAMK